MNLQYLLSYINCVYVPFCFQEVKCESEADGRILRLTHLEGFFVMVSGVNVRQHLFFDQSHHLLRLDIAPIVFEYLL